jgi:hypothetical protein
MDGTPKPCYLIFKDDGSAQFPMYRTTEGKVALMLFKSREAAQAFVDGKSMANEWVVEERSQVACIEWVREAVKRHGASELAIDPDPATAGSAAKVIPILAFLIELEGVTPD